MGLLGLLALLISPWVVYWFLGQQGIQMDFWIPLVITLSTFSFVYAEISYRTCRLVYRLFRGYPVNGPQPRELVNKVFIDAGIEEFRVFSNSDSYFASNGGQAFNHYTRFFDLAPELTCSWTKKGGKTEDTGGPYIASSYGLLAREMGMAVQIVRPGALMRTNHFLTPLADIAGFIYIFPIIVSPELAVYVGALPVVGFFPYIALFITGFLLLGVVLFYTVLRIPIEFHAWRLGIRLLKQGGTFEKRELRIINMFTMFYFLVNTLLIILLIFAIFVPMSRLNRE